MREVFHNRGSVLCPAPSQIAPAYALLVTEGLTLGPYRALDLAFAVTVEQAELGLAARLERCLEGLTDTCAGPAKQYRLAPDESAAPAVDGGPSYLLRYEGDIVGRGMTLEAAHSLLAWHVNSSCVETTLQRTTLLHSAAVVRDGLALALPATMESGKSTTTTGLLRRGWAYLTDEAVEIRPADFEVQPFPKSVALDPGSWPLFPELKPADVHPDARQWHIPPSTFPAGVAQPAPLLAVVSPKYAADAPTHLERLGGSEAVMQLAPATFAFSRHPERNLAFLATLVRRVPVYRLTIGDLESGLDAVDSVFNEALGQLSQAQAESDS